MITIWKIPLRFEAEQVIAVPSGAQSLTASFEDNNPVLWVWVDTAQPPSFQRIAVVGTNAPAPDWAGPVNYVATIQLENTTWHVFASIG